MVLKIKIIFMFLLLGLLRLSAAPDMMILKTGQTNDINFFEFNSGRIYFEDEKNPKKASTSKMILSISEIVLLPPGNVTVKYRNGKSDSSFKLKSYKDSDFIFAEKSGKLQNIAYRDILSIKMDMDFERSKAKHDTHDLTKRKERAEDFDIDSLAQKGFVTVVQLHMPDLMQSTRTWNYVKSLENNKRIKVKPVRITINDWENPLIKQYDIKALPQFWFYDKSGNLETKLIKRFTSNDIDEAVKQANHL